MQAWTYILIPAAAAIFGAAVAVNLRPGPVLVSAIQHFAAAVVFAAAGEILPDLKHAGAPWASPPCCSSRTWAGARRGPSG